MAPEQVLGPVGAELVLAVLARGVLELVGQVAVQALDLLGLEEQVVVLAGQAEARVLEALEVLEGENLARQILQWRQH